MLSVLSVSYDGVWGGLEMAQDMFLCCVSLRKKPLSDTRRVLCLATVLHCAGISSPFPPSSAAPPSCYGLIIALFHYVRRLGSHVCLCNIRSGVGLSWALCARCGRRYHLTRKEVVLLTVSCGVFSEKTERNTTATCFIWLPGTLLPSTAT